MSNQQAYAEGLLTRALDPQSQPSLIREFLRQETDLIHRLVKTGMRVVDIGCGTGRHLCSLAPRLSRGLGIDYEPAYIEAAASRAESRPLHFLVADAVAVPTLAAFDIALCTTNTWGTMPDKRGVLDEMHRLAPRPGSRFITVYAPASVGVRCEWYARLGQEVVELTDEWLLTRAGFRSEHFTEARIRSLVGDCRVQPLTDVAFFVST